MTIDRKVISANVIRRRKVSKEASVFEKDTTYNKNKITDVNYTSGSNLAKSVSSITSEEKNDYTSIDSFTMGVKAQIQEYMANKRSSQAKVYKK